MRTESGHETEWEAAAILAPFFLGGSSLLLVAGDVWFWAVGAGVVPSACATWRTRSRRRKAEEEGVRGLEGLGCCYLLIATATLGTRLAATVFSA